MNNPMLSIQQAAYLLAKPPSTLRRWALQGRIPATRTPQGWVIAYAEIINHR
jgi:excisionase family DNA binding protein